MMLTMKRSLICYGISNKKFIDVVADVFVKRKSFTGIQISSTDLQIYVVRMAGK